MQVEVLCKPYSVCMHIYSLRVISGNVHLVYEIKYVAVIINDSTHK